MPVNNDKRKVQICDADDDEECDDATDYVTYATAATIAATPAVIHLKNSERRRDNPGSVDKGRTKIRFRDSFDQAHT